MFWGTYPYSHPIARRSPDGRDAATVRTAVALASAGYPPAADADYSGPVSPYLARAHARMRLDVHVTYCGLPGHQEFLIASHRPLYYGKFCETPEAATRAYLSLVSTLSPAGASPAACDGGVP